MGHWAWLAAAGVAILTSVPAVSAPRLISGKYVLDPGQSDNVAHAIDRAGPSSFNVNWQKVRGRLLKSSLATDGLRIWSIPGRFQVKDDSPKPVIYIWTNGEPIKWKLNDGQVLDVSAKEIGEAVSLTFRQADIEQTTVFRSVGEQLVIDTTITSPGFSSPIRYKLVYDKAESSNQKPE
jgi:hypothetical protein